MPGLEGIPLGNQIFVDTDLKDSYDVIGKDFARKDGYDKVSGRAVYTRDVTLPGMLYAVYLRSPYANATIKSLDATDAEQYPGVRFVLTYEDPEFKDLKVAGRAIPVWYLGPNAYYYRQPVGAIVVADTEQIAREAVRLLKVEWEEKDFVQDPEEAMQPDAVLVDETSENNSIGYGYSGPVYQLGDIDAGLAEADQVIEYEGKKAQISGAAAEPVSIITKWDGQGKLECWHHTQCPGNTRSTLASYFGIPWNNVLVNATYQGCMNGHFQWGTSPYTTLPVVSAILARRTGRPVKIMYDRQDDFLMSAMEYCKQSGKIGIKNDGTVVAFQNTCYFANMGLGPYEHLYENTRVPNQDFLTTYARCNIPPGGAMRCEQIGNLFALSMCMNDTAATLGMDPTEVALKNDGNEGGDVENVLAEFKEAHGFPVRDSLRECIEKGKAAIDWDNKWHSPGSKQLANGRMHGMGMLWSHEWQDACGDASMGIAFNLDGSVSLIAQVSDIGVNHRSSLSQIAAEEIGVPYDSVSFLDRGHSTQTFELEPPEGSAAFTANAWAAKYAARRAKAALLEFVTHDFQTSSGWGGHPRFVNSEALFPGKTAEELDIKDGVIFEIADTENSMTVAEVCSKTSFGGRSAGAGGTAPGVFAWQFISQPVKADATSECHHKWLCRNACFLEIEVDIETGEVFTQNIVVVNDVGKVISPASVEGQQYGATYMAWGRAFGEEYIWDPMTGVQVNPNLYDYKVATIKDYAPSVIKCETVETGMGWGAYGTVGVGELASTMVWAMYGPAIYNAIGKRIEDYPITPDKVLKALGKA